MSATPVPFSFHCIICFEAFDLTERYPVTLPCGHTFVCHPCSKRLTKCMECRTSLYNIVPKVKPAPPHFPTSYSPTPIRHRHRPLAPVSPDGRNPKNHPPEVEKVPLPVPKNLVLMTLMEASQASAVKQKEAVEKEYESGDDDEMVTGSMRFLSSSCGTYVVREKQGLLMHKTADEMTRRRSSKEFRYDLEQPLLKVFACGTHEALEKENIGKIQGKDGEEQSEPVPRSPPETHQVGEFLPYGKTLQVVQFKDGMAKIARGKGFVKASETQLVKIGAPLDKACKVEGMLAYVAEDKLRFQKKVVEVEQLEASLNEELKEAMQSAADDERLPSLYLPEWEESDGIRSETPGQLTARTPPPDSSPVTPGVSDVTGRGDLWIGQSLSDPQPSRSATTPEKNNGDATPPSPVTVSGTDGIGSSWGWNSFGFGDNASVNETNHQKTRSHPVVTRVQSWRGPGTPDRSDTVDFRTGLSGHYALTSASAKRAGRKRSEIRMMGEHRGIASIGNIRRTNSHSSP